MGSAGGCTILTVTQGTVDLNGQNFTCSSTATVNSGGTLSNFSTFACTTFTNNGSTISLASGAINASVSIVQSSGSFTIGAATIGATPTFTHTAGTVTFNSSQSLAVTGTYTFTAGTLTLADGVTLSTGIFSSSNTNTRAIAFGSASAGNINLTHTTATTVVLSMAIVTNFTYTGPGGFTVADMANTRTLTYGTTGGSTSNAVNLTFTTGASVATLTTAGWFKNLDFGTTSFNPGTTALNIAGNLTLSSTGTYTGLTFTPLTSATYTFNGASVGAIAFNYSGITITMGSAGGCSTLTMTAGTIDFAGYNFTCSGTATYNSTGTLSNFGTFACTTFTNNGATLSLTSGAINASTSFVQSSGSFTIGGSATLGATPLFTHTAGTVTFNSSQSLAVTGTYTFTAGTLNIDDGVTLSTGIFSSTNANTRTINFGLTTNPGYISLTHTTAATVVLSMAIVTGLTVNALGKWDGNVSYGPTQVAGGFRSETTVTKTFTCGTTGGNSTNAPCLYVTGTGGTQLPTFTTGSWFGDFSIYNLSTMTIAATTLNINSLYGQGYYVSLNTTSMGLNFVGSGFINNQGGIDNTFGILGAVTINHAGTTAMIYGICGATTVALTAGTLECRYWANGPFNGISQFALTGAVTQTGGTWYNNAVYINTCTTYTINGPTISFDSGSITATTSMVLTSGSFTFNGGTISALPLFTHTAGTLTIKNSQTVSLAATGTYTFTAGSLILEDAAVLNTGIFSSSGTGTRSITFGTTATYPAFINLTHTTAATTVLIIATATGFSCTASYNPAIGQGYSGFKSDMPATQTFVFGTTGGSISNAPNLKINGSSTPTITTASWFNILDFSASQTFTLPATSLNLNSLIPAYGYNTVVLTGLTANMRGPGFLLATGASSIGPLVINNSGTTQLVSGFFPPYYGAGTFYCTTLTITAGNFDGGVQKFTGSCTAGVLTTTGSPTLVPGSNLYDSVGVPYGYSGSVVSGSSNTWVLGDLTTSFASKDLWVGGSESYLTPSYLTCSGAVTWTGGTLTNFGSTTAYIYGDGKNSITWTCTTFTVNGSTFNHTLENGGTINPSTSFVLTAGSYTYNGGVLGAVPLFTHTAGTATFNYSYSLTTTGTYTLTAGTLTLAAGVTLATGIFSSSGAGTRAIGFGASVTSGSVAFNGVDQYLTVPSSTALTLGTGDFTVEAWINPITVAGGANQFNIITLGSLQFYVSDGTLYFYDVNVNAGGGTVVINQWQHLAVTRIGTLVTAYINGIPYIYTSSGVNFIAATTYIGNNLGGALAWGYISNLRVVKGVSVYTIAAFAPPTTALTAVTGTQLLVDVASSGAYLTDGSTNNFTLTPAGTVTYNASTPVSTGGSLYFQSASSRLTLPSSSAFDITGDFTIEAWVQSTAFTAGGQGILDTRVAAQTSAPWVFYITPAGNVGFFTGTYYASTYPIVLNVWTHVAVVRSGSILTFFINGVQSGSTYIGTGAISPGTTSAVIGTKDYVINANFRAINYITNLRFVNGTALYAPNAGSFTPPTGQLASTQSANTNGNPSSAITGTQTSLLLNTVNGANFLTDSSTYTATVTNNGTATTSSRNPFAGYVNLTHTTAATVVLNMAALGGFTYTGNGGFAVAEMTNTRTFSVASTSGGSTTNAVNLYFTSGASVATLTTAGWINNLDFGFTSFNPGTTTLNINGGLVLSSSGTYTGLTPSFRSDSTLTSNGKTVAALVVNAPTFTLTTNDATSITGALTLTAGALVAPYDITSGSFASAGPYSRSITGSTTTYTITGAGATAWSFASTGSVLLNGTSQYLSVANNAAFAFGSGPFTVECWFYQTSYAASSTGNSLVMLWKATTGRAFNFYVRPDGALEADWNTSSGMVGGATSLNTWYHAAFVSDGTNFYLYLDGVQVATAAAATIVASTDPLFIGANNDSTSPVWRFRGYITNVRLAKGVAVYTGNFTVPTAPLLPTQSSSTNISAITGTQTSLLLSTPSNSFLTDYSVNNFTVTNTGTATANILSPFAVTSPGITFTSFTLSMTAATAKTFAGGGATYPTLNQGGAGALTISGNNSFGDLTATTRPSTITFTISTTQTFTNFTLSGTAGNLVTINSSSAGTQATLSKTSGTVSVGYLSIRDSNATGGANWDAGATSSNVSNNTGWIFGGYVFTAGGDFFAFF